MTTNISGQGLILLPLFGGRKKFQRRWPLKANFWILIRFIIDLRHKEREDLTLCAYRYNKLKFWWISHDLMEQSEILHHFKMFRRHSQSMQDYSHMQMTFASLRTPKWTLALEWFPYTGVRLVHCLVVSDHHYTVDFSLKGPPASSHFAILCLQCFAKA